jgi:hypothetical protein
MANPPQRPSNPIRGITHDGFTPLQKGYQPTGGTGTKPAAPTGGSNVASTSTSSNSSGASGGANKPK